MEDLIPFLIFLAIGAVNLINFMAKKGRQSQQTGGNAAPRRPPSQLERFFEQLSEQLNPQEPTELPDWPEGYERPDYVHEMEEFEESQPETLVQEPPAPEFQDPEPPPPAPAIPAHNRRRVPAYRIDGKNGLRQAMLAHIVFSPPRALDLSFENTISK